MLNVTANCDVCGKDFGSFKEYPGETRFNVPHHYKLGHLCESCQNSWTILAEKWREARRKGIELFGFLLEENAVPPEAPSIPFAGFGPFNAKEEPSL